MTKTNTATTDVANDYTDDVALSSRDDRVTRMLTHELNDLATRSEDARREAARCDRLARDIRAWVQREEWWRLAGVLSVEDIESLCNVSPVGLLDRNSEED